MSFRSYLIYASVFMAGFGIHAALDTKKPPQTAVVMQKSVLPDQILISGPVGSTGRTVYHLQPTRQGVSHDSDGMAPDAWRVVVTGPGGSWFYEAAQTYVDR